MRLRLREAVLVAASLILVRSAVWVLWEQSYFDSDQAIVGLMAKHAAQLRAFPLVFYGQQYMLAVESWLAVPGFLLFGASVATLKAPLVALNVLVAAMLIGFFVRDARLSAGAALASSMFFVLPPPVTSSRLVEAQGGNIEPFVYVLLLWLTRSRPIAFGLIAGVGSVHREFTLYGVLAILLLEGTYGVLFTRENLWAKAIVFVEIAGVALLTHVALGYADLLGPGTRGTLSAEVLNGQFRLWAARFCWAPAAMLPNLSWLVRENLGTLFGWRVGPFKDFVSSSTSGGHLWVLPAFVAVVAAAAVVGIASRAKRQSASIPAAEGLPARAFPMFLMLVGVITLGVYSLASCNVQDAMLVRYTLLGLLIPVGAAAYVFAAGPVPIAKVCVALGIAGYVAASALDDGRLLAEYMHHPPRADYRELADFLEREGVRYAEGPYWTAYYIDFLTDERVIVGSYEKVRINEYENAVKAHAAESAALYFDDPCTPDQDGVNFRRWCVLYFTRARHLAPAGLGR
jgi:hypothetical protein